MELQDHWHVLYAAVSPPLRMCILPISSTENDTSTTVEHVRPNQPLAFLQTMHFLFINAHQVMYRGIQLWPVARLASSWTREVYGILLAPNGLKKLHSELILQDFSLHMDAEQFLLVFLELETDRSSVRMIVIYQ